MMTSEKKQKASHSGRWGLLVVVAFLGITAVWLYASIREWIWGERLFPWSAYALCGNTQPKALPETVRIGLYEEYPVPWRLDKLAQVDFPVSLAVAAPSVTEFAELKQRIQLTYPLADEVFYWPLLSKDEGYYPGPFSKSEAVERVTNDAEQLPVLWDWELPLGTPYISFQNWWQVRAFTSEWLSQRTQPTHIWRSHTSMGLDPVFLRLVGMHYDPRDYPNLYFHLNLYSVGDGMPPDELYRILRCGVEKYGEHFIPDFGALNDGEGPDEIFIPVATLRQELQLAREAGVKEIWLFGVNGVNEEYLDAVHELIPLEPVLP